MTTYDFYRGRYMGDSIPESDFLRLSIRAEAQLERYKRIYTVTGSEDAEEHAICAMADALYYFETAENSTQSVSVGSVSCSKQQVDVSPKAQARELYRCASLYLDIYRGCS